MALYLYDRSGDDQSTVSMNFVSPSSPAPPEVSGALELTASGPSGTPSEPSTVSSPTGAFQHPLSVAASAMLDIQQSQVEESHLMQHGHHQQQQIYQEYSEFKNGVAVSSADEQLHSPSHLVAAPELGLLLTGVDPAGPVKREAEDLTAAPRRSPDHQHHLHQQQRRLVSLEDAQLPSCHSPSTDTRFATPPHHQQLQQLAPLAVSPRPLVYGGGHYSALSPGAVFVDTAPVSALCQYTSSSNSAQLASPPPPALSQQPPQTPHSPTYSSVAAGGSDYYRDYYQLEPYPVTGARSTLVYSAGELSDPAVSGHAGHGGHGGQSSLPPPLQQQQQLQQHHGLAFIGERFVSVSGVGGYKVSGAGLAMDLPSPDSGIGAEAATPRDQTALVHQGAVSYTDYSELCGSANGLLPAENGLMRPELDGSPASSLGVLGRTSATRSWHDYGRQSEVDKIHIPKIFSNYGFRFFMESPISTSQRREDDRMTYVNKGQFYGITMEYVPDPDQPLKNMTVKSVVLLVFREEKSLEDEMKAWQFWHSRQHSVKQRILDVDTKNSIGLVGSIEEVSHNAIAVYWNPLESPAKISIAVQCLSTDFSSQKGVKGLPLHIQIDTYEDYRDASSPVSHRAYVQIKSFCDKGAERKTRDEERRATKRKMTVTGRKKMEEMYHPSCERSEFYSMADTLKAPMLFQPSDDEPDRIGSLELQNYYSHGETEQHMCVDTVASANESQQISTELCASPMAAKYQYSYSTGSEHDQSSDGSKESSVVYSSAVKRARMSPQDNQRVMLYVRQEQEQLFTPLHVVPPTTMGLLHAIASKYKVASSCVHTLCRKNHKGVTAIMDDDMIQHYCNEDTFLLEIRQVDPDGPFDVTLVELCD